MLWDIAKAKVAIVMRHAAREANTEIERRQRHQERGKLVFLWGGKLERHIVHRAFFGKHPRQKASCELLCGEKGIGINDLIGVGELKLRLILCQKLMQQRCAAAPVSEDEKRCFGRGGLADGTCETPILNGGKARV